MTPIYRRLLLPLLALPVLIVTLTDCNDSPSTTNNATPQISNSQPATNPVTNESDSAHDEALNNTHQDYSSLCAVGDAGSGSRSQRDVSLAMHLAGCTHILYLGDNFYDHGVPSTNAPAWDYQFRTPNQALLNSGARFLVSLGNHDYLGQPQAQVDYVSTAINQIRNRPAWFFGTRDGAFTLETESSALPPPSQLSRFYKVQWGPFCFYAIDTNRPNTEQATWLRSNLQGDRSQCAYQLVFGHHPLLSSGQHGHMSLRQRRHWAAAMQGATAYLAGHDHNFEYTLIRDSALENEAATSNRIAESSTVLFPQFIVGTGGAGLRDSRCQTQSCCDDHCQNFIKTKGFLKLTPTTRGLQIEFINKHQERLFQTVLPSNESSSATPRSVSSSATPRSVSSSATPRSVSSSASRPHSRGRSPASFSFEDRLLQNPYQSRRYRAAPIKTIQLQNPTTDLNFQGTLCPENIVERVRSFGPHAIVTLGARFHRGTPSLALKQRAYISAQIFKTLTHYGQKPVVIFSGGHGEAEAMQHLFSTYKDRLVAVTPGHATSNSRPARLPENRSEHTQEVAQDTSPNDRSLIENRSQSTIQNAHYSNRILRSLYDSSQELGHPLPRPKKVLIITTQVAGRRGTVIDNHTRRALRDFRTHSALHGTEYHAVSCNYDPNINALYF